MQIQSKTNGDYSNGKMPRLILGQAVPLALAQLVQLMYNIVDRIYIGHMPGEESAVALTGLGLCFPIITFITAFINLISTGASPLCSMDRGKQNKREAQSIMDTAFVSLILICLCLPLIIYIVQRPLLYLLGASDVTYTYASEYLHVYILGTVFLGIGTGMNAFINLSGYPRIGMLTTVIGACINLLLDPLFIFVLHMGVRGAATATVISQFISAAWVLMFLLNKDRELHLSLLQLQVDFSLLKNIITLGAPGFIRNATTCLVQAVCNSTLSIHGGDSYIAIMTIINSVREMVDLPLNGITDGAKPVLSYNYGAKNYNRVKQGIRFTALNCFVYALLFWITTMLFPGFFLRLFCSHEATVNLGLGPLKIYFMGFVFMSLQFAGQSAFVALGRARQAVFFSLFRKVIIVLPLTLLLPYIGNLGVLGVFAAEPISNLIGGLACFITMYFTTYRKLGSEK